MVVAVVGRWWRGWWWRGWWWWPAGRDLVVEDVLLGGAVDQDAAVDPGRVDRSVHPERAVVVTRVAGLDVRVGLQRQRGDRVADRGRCLPGRAVVGRQATEALQIVVGRVALVIPADEHVPRGRDRQRRLPLPTRPTVAVQAKRRTPRRAVVGRAHVVDVALIAARPVRGVRVMDDIVRADTDVAPAHMPPQRPRRVVHRREIRVRRTQTNTRAREPRPHRHRRPIRAAVRRDTNDVRARPQARRRPHPSTR